MDITKTVPSMPAMKIQPARGYNPTYTQLLTQVVMHDTTRKAGIAWTVVGALAILVAVGASLAGIARAEAGIPHRTHQTAR